MIINRIVKNLFPVRLLGLTIAEIQNLSMSTRDIADFSEAKEEDSVLCVIYDDMPLLTKNTLLRLAKICSEKSCGFILNNGFIVKTDCSDELLRCETEETEVFLPEKYSFFVKKLQKRINSFHLANGVVIEDTDAAFIDFSARICSKAVIKPFVTVSGDSYIGKNAVIGQNSVVVNSHIGDDCVIRSSTIENSIVGDYSSVGPYAYLRNGARIGKNCRVGDFVEIKNSTLSDNVKAAHLCYIGDAEVGDGTNVGCGAVFCNYDGKNKHKTVVGKNVFIGANANLVAPLTVGDGAFIAAGSTVTRSVDDDAFVIARSKQITRPITR